MQESDTVSPDTVINPSIQKNALSVVTVVIVHYQHIALTLACLTSLKQASQDDIDLRIIIVANGCPQDDWETLQALSNQDNLSIELIHSLENLGYSGGNNLGIRHALKENTEFIWLLNNDALIEAETLPALLCQHTRLGSNNMVASIQIHPETRQFVYAGGSVDWLRGTTEGLNLSSMKALEDRHASPDYISAASLLIPAHIIKQIGLLEESYFLYAEDIEYSVRATRQGVQLALVPESVILHAGGATSGGWENPLTLYYFLRNRYLFFNRYASPWQKITIAIFSIERLLQAGLKAFFKLGKRKKLYQSRFRIQLAALIDFVTGKTGRCSHSDF